MVISASVYRIWSSLCLRMLWHRAVPDHQQRLCWLNTWLFMTVVHFDAIQNGGWNLEKHSTWCALKTTVNHTTWCHSSHDGCYGNHWVVWYYHCKLFSMGNNNVVRMINNRTMFENHFYSNKHVWEVFFYMDYWLKPPVNSSQGSEFDAEFAHYSSRATIKYSHNSVMLSFVLVLIVLNGFTWCFANIHQDYIIGVDPVILSVNQPWNIWVNSTGT